MSSNEVKVDVSHDCCVSCAEDEDFRRTRWIGYDKWKYVLYGILEFDESLPDDGDQCDEKRHVIQVMAHSIFGGKRIVLFKFFYKHGKGYHCCDEMFACINGEHLAMYSPFINKFMLFSLSNNDVTPYNVPHLIRNDKIAVQKILFSPSLGWLAVGYDVESGDYGQREQFIYLFILNATEKKMKIAKITRRPILISPIPSPQITIVGDKIYIFDRDCENCSSFNLKDNNWVTEQLILPTNLEAHDSYEIFSIDSEDVALYKPGTNGSLYKLRDNSWEQLAITFYSSNVYLPKCLALKSTASFFDERCSTVVNVKLPNKEDKVMPLQDIAMKKILETFDSCYCTFEQFLNGLARVPLIVKKLYFGQSLSNDVVENPTCECEIFV